MNPHDSQDPQLPPCLVLGADANESLPVIKNLARHGVSVTAAAPRRISVGLFSRYPTTKLVYPDPEDQPNDFLNWLEDRIAGDDYPVTLVCGEQITALIAQHRRRFDEHTTIPLVDKSIFSICRNKANTMRAAQELGIDTPRTWFPDEKGIKAVADDIDQWPVVVKPAISNGARGIRFSHNPDELRQHYQATREEFGEVIIQDFIPAGGNQYKAELLLDREGELLAAGVYDKPRFYPPKAGSSTLNSTIERPDLIEHSQRLLNGIDWFGMGDCEFIEDPRNGRALLMEVNPRFTRSIKILVEAGIDYPWLLYRVALGLPVEPQFDYQKGLYMRYLLSDCMWFIRSPDRFRARPSFFWFFGRNLCGEIFSWSDPAPALAHGIGKTMKLFDKRKRRFILRMES